MNDKHKQLQERAIRRLYAFGCHVFAKEVPTTNGIADALGVNTRTGNAYYIECKTSRSDLICEKQRNVYRRATGELVKSCYYHTHNDGQYRDDPHRPRSTCLACIEDDKRAGDTHIDFYYLMIDDNINVEAVLYPHFGVINERGQIIRKAKRMKRIERDNAATIEAIAHVLVYKVYGKLYE